MMAKTKHVDRTVIEDTLLLALSDEDKVAIIVTDEELQLLITGLTYVPSSLNTQAFREDLRKLRRAAFGR